MDNFLLATAHGIPADDLLGSCLRNLGPVPEGANLGFVYATDTIADEVPEFLVRLKTLLPQVSWVGGIGIGVCSTAREYYDQPALVILVGSFPEDSFRVVSSLGEGPSSDPQLPKWCNDQQSSFALLHGDPVNPNIPEALEHIMDNSYSCFLNGGLTSSRGTNFQIANNIEAGNLSGVLFNDQVTVYTDHTQGCMPIGPIHDITKFQGNIAERLDGRPALEVLKEDIGEVLSRNLTQSVDYIYCALPIKGTDTGDYLVRNLMGIDEINGLIAIGDHLENQSCLMFCRRDGNSAREDMIGMLQRLKSRTGDEPIRGGIYVSCLGRGRYQFGDNSEELRLIQEHLGDFPLAGFFANGEIYNGRLYGYTGVLTLFL
jgi:small ligand-binding sensory domain FIST